MKNHFQLMILVLVQALALYPVGAGLCLYRVTLDGIQFLVVKDPYQSAFWRQGFEFAAGTIGDYGHRKMDELDGKKIDALSSSKKSAISVSCYLRGAIREGLEELVFAPASYLINGYAYHKNGKINKKFAKKAIDAVAQNIKDQGLICLRNLEDKVNYTIFFWNVTNFDTKHLLPQIQAQRQAVLQGWFCRVSSIGAEPDQFAWVSAQEIQKIIMKIQKEKQMNFGKAGTYQVVAKELVDRNLPLQRDVSINLSPAFAEMISNNTHSVDPEKSMSAIIRLLREKHGLCQTKD